SLILRTVTGDVRGANLPPSIEQVNVTLGSEAWKRNVAALAPVTAPRGPPRNVVVGGIVSTVKTTGSLMPAEVRLPAWEAWTVKTPSGSGVVGVTDQRPS